MASQIFGEFLARHSQLSTSERFGTKKSLALVPKLLGVPRLPCRGSLGTPN